MAAPEAGEPSHELESERNARRTVELSQLFREHNRALVLFLASRLKNIQAAREVAQEAYVRVLELDTPGAISFLRSYLFKVAANLLLVLNWLLGNGDAHLKNFGVLYQDDLVCALRHSMTWSRHCPTFPRTCPHWLCRSSGIQRRGGHVHGSKSLHRGMAS